MNYFVTTFLMETFIFEIICSFTFYFILISQFDVRNLRKTAHSESNTST